jgi:hypothetical protein
MRKNHSWTCRAFSVTKKQKNPRTWTNLGAIFLPGLTTPRHENRKIRYKSELLQAKEPTPDV